MAKKETAAEKRARHERAHQKARDDEHDKWREGKGAKSAFLEKVKVEPLRKARYKLAHLAFQRRPGNGDVLFSAWQRMSLDLQADEDLKS